MRRVFLILTLAPLFILDADGAPDFMFSTSPKGKTARATSVLREKNKPAYFYAARRAVDGKLSTAWCAGKKGGIGESLTVRFKPSAANAVYIFNGYGATRRLYHANNRVRRAEITVFHRNGRRTTFRRNLPANQCKTGDERACMDGTPRENAKCMRRLNRICHLGWTGGPNGVWSNEAVPIKPTCVTGIRIKILGVHRGKKYNDTCIAEVNVMAPVIGRVPELEKIRKSCR